MFCSRFAAHFETMKFPGQGRITEKQVRGSTYRLKTSQSSGSQSGSADQQW